MNPMVPGLAGGKMSASDPDSKIDLLDTPEVVKKKLRKAYAVPKEVDGNGIISFVEYVLLPVDSLKNNGHAQFKVERREDEGGDVVYDNIESLKEDYKADQVRCLSCRCGSTIYLSDVALRPAANPLES